MATADRGNRIRLTVMAFGIALCALALLGVATINPLLNSILDRTYASQPSVSGSGPAFQARQITNPVAGEMVDGTLLAGPADATPPPGTDAFPRPGELVVSPALADALSDPDRGDLRALLAGGRIVGQIDASVLVAPREWSYYQGVATLPADAASGTGWGTADVFSVEGGTSVADVNPQLWAILLTGVAVLMIPLLLFTAMAGRIGAAHRDRRSATLRLLGASTAQLRWIVAAEVALASVAGLVLAAGAYLMLRAFAPLISVSGYGAQSSDVHPDLTAAAVIAVAVPALAASSALAGSRQAAVTPLGDQTRPVRRPALWWRVLLLGATAAITPYVLYSSQFGEQSMIRGTVQLCALVVLDILCVAALVGPVTHGAAAAALGHGGPSVQLAQGRILRQPGLSTRPAAAVATVLASVIALMSILSVRPDVDPVTGGEGARPYRGQVNNLTFADWQRLYTDLNAVAGATAVEMIGVLPLSSPHAFAEIATCTSISSLADTGTPCADGDVFGQIGVPGSTGGDQFTVDGTTTMWTAPANSRNTYFDVGDDPTVARNAYFLTPSVVEAQIPDIGSIADVNLMVWMPPSSLPAAREAVAWLGQNSATVLAYTDFDSGMAGTYSWVRVVLLAGAAFVLLISALAQWLLAAEYVNDRRRAFALARASGVPLSTLTRSVLIGALFPVLTGSVIAAAVGTLLAWEFATARGSSFLTIDVTWLGIGCIVTVLVSLLVAAGSAARLRRTTGPSALRTG